MSNNATVGFSDDLWAVLEHEAGKDGVSAAQFVRDAALLRLGALAAQRGEDGGLETLEAIADAARPGAGSADPITDPDRVAALHATGLVDTGPEESFDRLAEAARRMIGAPLAAVVLVDADRQYLKSCVGAAVGGGTELPLSHSFCRHAVADRAPLVVGDTRKDPRLRDNPSIAEFDAIAYLGIPLVTAAGHAIGSLCVIDHQPRAWTTDEIELLERLAAAVMDRIEPASLALLP
jgi:hypothetical protein